MKKILILTTTIDFGGAERSVVDTAKALAKSKNYYPIVCSLLDKGEMRGELKNSGVKYCSPNLKNIKNIFSNIIKVRRVIKKYQPDIIHTNQGAADFYGSVAAVGLGIPVISHIRNPDAPQPFSRKIARFFISLFLIDVFISTIEEKAESLKRMIPSTKDRIYILYNAIDQKRLALPENFNKTICRKKLLIPRENFVVGSVGRLVWEKGYDLLLEAFAKIKKSNLTLVIVGSGPDEKKLKGLAQKLGIKNKVIFTGYRKDTAALMSIFDVFVVSSKLESFSLVSLEAMHLGVPVIITDRLSSKDILSRAALVIPCSVEGLRNGIVKLLKDKNLRNEMSARGKKMIKEEFTINTYIKRLELIYDKTLKTNNK